MSATAVRPSDSTYESPFKGSQNSTKVPDFSHYAAKNGANKNLMYQYFMVGAMGTITAAGAKSTIQGEPRRAAPGSRECWVVGAEGFNWGRGTQGNNKLWLGGSSDTIRALRLTDATCRVPEEHVCIC